jgi:hypothetical protein
MGRIKKSAIDLDWFRFREMPTDDYRKTPATAMSLNWQEFAERQTEQSAWAALNMYGDYLLSPVF